MVHSYRCVHLSTSEVPSEGPSRRTNMHITTHASESNGRPCNEEVGSLLAGHAYGKKKRQLIPDICSTQKVANIRKYISLSARQSKAQYLGSNSSPGSGETQQGFSAQAGVRTFQGFSYFLYLCPALQASLCTYHS